MGLWAVFLQAAGVCQVSGQLLQRGTAVTIPLLNAQLQCQILLLMPSLTETERKKLAFVLCPFRRHVLVRGEDDFFSGALERNAPQITLSHTPCLNCPSVTTLNKDWLLIACCTFARIGFVVCQLHVLRQLSRQILQPGAVMTHS